MTKKIFISVILLLVYTIGFSHNLIPHTHDIDTEDEIVVHNEDHHHHKTHKEKHANHEHISHGDHFDEGFYELLICFLHTAENQSKDCDNHYYIATDHNRIITSKQQVKLLATIVALYNEPEESFLFSEFYAVAELKIRPPLITNSPLRGPPSFL